MGKQREGSMEEGSGIGSDVCLSVPYLSAFAARTRLLHTHLRDPWRDGITALESYLLLGSN
jgi:hypothetical protein